MKQTIFIGIILLSLSSYTFAADQQATSETTAKPTTAPASTPQDAEKPKVSPNPNGASPQKPSIADYCREHTC